MGHALLDHLVGADHQRLRECEAKRLRGLEIDGKLELGGQLNWQVAGFGALENAIDVDLRSSPEVGVIDSI